MPLSAFWWQELLWPTGATTSIAIKLFQSSVFTVDNIIAKQNVRIADFITACLHRILPLSWQNAFRNAGGISILSDLSVLILGATMALTDVQLLLDMVQISKKISRFQYGATATHRVEIFRPVNNVVNFGKSARSAGQVITSNHANKTSKILVFVHGGAWGCGQLWQYRLVANGLGNIIGATSVVLIGYPTYPTAGILQQRDCITEAVRFIRQDPAMLKLLQINRTTPDTADMNYDAKDVYVPYGNSIDTMVLCGHSSGANICALSLLDSCHTTTAAHSAITNDTAPSKHHVDVFVGLCGPYDIVKHYLFEERRGVHVVSPMTAAAGGKAGLPQCSPTLLAELLFNNKSTSSRDTDTAVLSMPHTVLLHGEKDATVPVASSADYAAALSKLNISNELVITKSDHMEPLLEGLYGVRTPHSETSTALRKALRYLDE
eukprot:gene12631-14600_t